MTLKLDIAQFPKIHKHIEMGALAANSMIKRIGNGEKYIYSIYKQQVNNKEKKI